MRPQRTLAQGAPIVFALLQQAAAAPVAPAQGPTFDCRMVKADSIEAMICADPDLSALDRTLAGVYAAATSKARSEHPPVLRAEQRGWVKGRNDCWKSSDARGCVRDEYVRRIAELQARYRLVPSRGPFRFACDGNPANEVVVTYFATEPSTLIAERGDSVSLMFQQVAASGAKYQGRNESFWEHQGVATIVWGYGAPEMRCTLKR
ncbi:MAG TPA: MliC family protein [Burkholderiaceae bacterium]|nr:MliC family protein [Burkholderiaceae bacterium]HQR71884.1 MliC family protein [Burkholderiaceae bacterium]